MNETEEPSLPPQELVFIAHKTDERGLYRRRVPVAAFRRVISFLSHIVICRL